MKKFAMIMALALPLAFASCGDDNNDNTVSLDKTSVTLDYGQTETLKASEKNGNWASSNEFVATVDKDGKIEAKHEGRATITYLKNGASASCTVTVNATNDNFNTILTWGATPAQIKAGIPDDLQLLSEKDGNLMYCMPGQKYPWYGFIFENGGLAGSSIYFTDEMFDNFDFSGYLNQRYQKIEDTDDGAVYADGFSLSEANTAVTVSYDSEDNTWTALWQPISHTKAAALNANLMKDAKLLYKAAKK